ncbi:MAG: PH domain-containing protein [Patescibacteria group bacterium]|jgi:hypothetical protein
MANNRIYKNLALNDDEKILKIVRQSGLKLLTSSILPAILIILPFFLLYPLFSLGNKGIAIFASLLFLGIIWFSRNWVIWSWKIFIISNQRIIDLDQQGIFKKVVSDISLAKIQDVFYEIKGLKQTLTRIGDIHIILNDGKTKIELSDVAQPQNVQRLILQLKTDTFQEKLENTKLSAQELVELVKKIKAGIGEDKFNQILQEQDKKNLE